MESKLDEEGLNLPIDSLSLGCQRARRMIASENPFSLTRAVLITVERPREQFFIR